jgi:hypothetical protein
MLKSNSLPNLFKSQSTIDDSDRRYFGFFDEGFNFNEEVKSYGGSLIDFDIWD